MKPIIQIKDLVARYGEKTVLDQITADVYQGQVTVILGGSGCGKTTLLKNILRLYEPYAGSVKIFDQEVVGLEEDAFNSILKRIGMLFQNGALLNSVDIFENISIPLEQHTNLPYQLRLQMIRVKLALVGLSHALHLTPGELSGGMKKRAALARAIALDPELLVCDEPSAGLDPLTSARLDELILKLKRELGMSILVVTHELASIHRIADRLLFLDDGKLVFTGTVEQAQNCGVEAVETFFKIGR